MVKFAQVSSREINLSLMTVAFVYFILNAPMVPLEFNLLDVWVAAGTAELWSLVIYSCYWWIYAANTLIYLATMAKYRTIYRILLRDAALALGATSLASYILPLELFPRQT